MTGLIFDEYPDLAEGEMAPLRASVVNMHSLADVARELDLGRHMRLGKGEEMGGGRDKDSLLADGLEALIGAVYLDRGLDAARAALVPIFRERLERAVAAGHRFDPKAALQERAVRDGHALPAYRVTGSGPDHAKRFEADVFVGGELLGSGRGRSKKEAEQDAAREALMTLEASDPNPKGAPDARAS